MSASLQIDFVSDVACPWCAIGLASLEEALRRTADVVTAKIHFQPFELNPAMHAAGENIDEYLGGRLGAGPERMAAMRKAVSERAANVGFEFNQDQDSRIYNTFDAHRLLYWARDTGRQRELKEVLFKANFTDGANISDPAVLAAAAASAGLDAQQAREVLATGRYAEEVRQAEQFWQSRGIQAVPAIVFNGQWLISGAQSPAAFEQAIREMACGTAS